MNEETPHTSVAGVYRYRHDVDGCPTYYVINEAGV